MEVQNVKSCECKGVAAVQAPCDAAERWCGVMAFVGEEMGRHARWVIVSCTCASPIAQACMWKRGCVEACGSPNSSFLHGSDANKTMASSLWPDTCCIPHFSLFKTQAHLSAP